MTFYQINLLSLFEITNITGDSTDKHHDIGIEGSFRPGSDSETVRPL